MKLWSKIRILGRYRKEESIGAYILLAPSLILLFVMSILPLLGSLYLSFTRYNMLTSPQWVGLQNYLDIINSEVVRGAIMNNLRYIIISVPIRTVLGLVLAVLLNAKLRGMYFFRFVFFTPQVTSTVAASMVFLWLYNPRAGLLNFLMRSLGLSRQLWLQDPHIAMYAVVALGVWQGLGVLIIVYLAGLQGIPNDLYEVSSLDGATGVQQFFHITLPLLKPVTVFALITQIIAGFKLFEQVYVMTKGGPHNSTTTVVHQIFVQAFQFLNMGYASAIAVVLLLIILAVSIFNMTVLKNWMDV